ncbi:cation:proton antiporter [Salinibacter altiplanensis]|uniref:cation:proton antiporter n=1 Tax=Salinibacter altiplanensis TaxID=1803181 RepID=UPI001E5DD3A3|nr:sodium:proton antiporter [Salinibacter altiplanensis]
MPESILLSITVVVVLGIGAQWAAWRFRLPSILLLLLVGFLAGPVLGVLDPQSLRGDWLFAFVSLSIGIILFEGGLSLQLSELREVGSTVLNLITIGVLTTWGLGAAAAHYILEFEVGLAVLIGAILTVTGPTVVVPLLRHVRPKGRVNTVAKWEGITIDPVGAILAVLVLETLILLNDPQRAGAGTAAAAEHVAIGIGLEIFVALGISVVATILLVVILRRRMVPDFLRNAVTLMVVVVAFVVANVLQHESGLLATTLMGIALANQPYVSVQRIIEFKENLQVLLIGSLFVLLSARLELSALEYIDLRVLVFLGILVVLVRPLAVFLSSFGSNLDWEEKAFLSWLAPRGIVAAAVASLFAYQLRPFYPEAIDGMVPIIFAVIVGTVAIYGLTLSPLARWLNLAEPNPNGLLFVGAAPWARTVAQHVQELGHSVLLLDNNPDHVHAAREAGLPAHQGNALSENILDEISLSGIGHLLITIPNDEVASLTALHFSEVFESTDIYQLAAQPDSRHGGEGVMPGHLRGRPLFGENTSYQSLRAHVQRGDRIEVLSLVDEDTDEAQEYYTYDDLSATYEDATVIPLFILRGGETLEIVSETSQFQLRPDDQFIALVGTEDDVRDQDHKTPEVDRVAKHEGPALEKAPTDASDGAS